MRVGLVTGEYPPMEGGVGAYTRELARAMVGMGHDVHVFTRKGAHSPESSNDPGITVTGVVRSKWGWGTLGSIARWANENALDIINLQFETAAFDMHPSIHWLGSRLTPHPLVVTFHDLRPPYLFPKAGFARTMVMKKLAQDASGVIATDRADERELDSHCSLRMLTWIPIGSNVRDELPPDFDRSAWRAKIGVSAGDLLISYFGFLNESKGGLVLVEALKCLVDAGTPAHLVMIGGRAGASDPTNHAYAGRVDAMIAKTGLTERVTWTGFVDNTTLSCYFHSSELTALPYLDGVSLRRGTLMAALEHGMPIVTTETQTHAPELDGVVHTVAAGDPAALADGIRLLWEDQRYRWALAESARLASRHFHWDDIASRTVTFYQNILDRRT